MRREILTIPTPDEPLDKNPAIIYNGGSPKKTIFVSWDDLDQGEVFIIYVDLKRMIFNHSQETLVGSRARHGMNELRRLHPKAVQRAVKATKALAKINPLLENFAQGAGLPELI